MSSLAPQKCFLTNSGSDVCENLVLSVKRGAGAGVLCGGQRGPCR